MSLSDESTGLGRSASHQSAASRVGRRRCLALVAIACAGLSLAACGYRPLYGRAAAGGQVSNELSKVRIGLIANRAGHRLRNQLLDRMNPRGEPVSPAYALNVRLVETRVDLGVRRDETRTRANLTLTAEFQLVDLSNNRLLFKAGARRVASFNIRDADFATISAESAARRRTVEGLADEITQRVAIYLNRKSTAKR
jgi:LPS-assembly lipoprotein